MILLGLNKKFGGLVFPASCLSVPWDTARCHKVCDFSVTSSVAAFGRGTDYSALSKAKYTRACGAPETRFINQDAVIKKQVFPPPSPHPPPIKKNPATKRTLAYKNVDY